MDIQNNGTPYNNWLNTSDDNKKNVRRQQKKWACDKINNLIQQSTYTPRIHPVAERIGEEKPLPDGGWHDDSGD
jgi:hypothetical protein